MKRTVLICGDLQISTFVAQFTKRPPIAAFTATATTQTITAITSTLKLHNPQVFRQSFLRSNLSIQVKHTEQYQLQEILVLFLLQKHAGQSGIIYTATHEGAEYLAQYIEKHADSIKTTVAYYHGGLKASERTYIQKLFLADKIKVIIATSAFGMGIDQIVKCVIIFGCPSSIEEYYQQIGRGGRDGLECETILYFDKCKYNKIFHSIKNDKTKIRNLKNLKKVYDYFLLKTCKRRYVLEYFGEECNFNSCGNCNNCKNNL